VHDNEIDDVAEAYAVSQVSKDAGEQQRARAKYAIVARDVRMK
jgi:hypothetical protein